MKVIFSCAVFIGVCFGVFGAASSVAAYPQATILARDPLLTYRSTECRTFEQTVAIQGFSDKLACISGGEQRLSAFMHNGTRHFAFGFRYDQSSYQLKDICHTGRPCLYAPQTDQLVTTVPKGGAVYELQVFNNFSEKLSLQFDMGLGRYLYAFDGSPPDFALRQVSGVTVPVIALALSKNGRWLVFELRDKGVGLLNLQTFQGRRVVAPGYIYGLGGDPQMELAVTNDGSKIAISGLNAGFRLFETEEWCGDSLVQPFSQLISNGARPCPEKWLSSNLLGHRFWRGYQPEFLSEDVLQIVLFSYEGRFHLLRTSLSGDGAQSSMLLGTGDSFSSGDGETDDSYYRPGTNDGVEKCHTSLRSYPYQAHLLAQISGEAHSIACSGARINDYFPDDTYRGQGGRLSALPSDEMFQLQRATTSSLIPGRVGQGWLASRVTPSVLTVGVGGNDAGVMAKVLACAAPGTCQYAHPEDWQLIAEEIDAIMPKLDGLYRTLKRQLPQTRIIVVGYPGIVADTEVCTGLTAVFTNDERRFMERSVAYLNQAIQTTASSAGLEFSDMANVFDGHRLCDTSDTPAMNELRFGGEVGIGDWKFIGTESFHPTPFGHSLMAARLASLLVQPAPLLTESPLEPTAADMSAIRRHSSLASLDAFDKTTLHVSVDPVTFRPGSIVRASMHLAPLSLGEYEVADDGSLAFSVGLSPELLNGIHTIRLVGDTAGGKTLELYDVVGMLFQNADHTPEDPLPIPREDQSAPKIESPGFPSQSAQSQLTAKPQAVTSEPLLPRVLGDTRVSTPVQDAPIPLAKTVDFPATNENTDYRWLNLAIVFILSSIIISWLLFALWLKKRSRRTSLEKLSQSDISSKR